ncbi:hypothetical protein B0H13DRAFT_1887218 [Mycena leptocephala]|nr:hypothetical protein B0H13DRAFT_1887218 [Mycena leptocephala]
MNCCSPVRNVDHLILQLRVDELEGSSCGAQSEDLRMLRGRRIVRVQYLRGRQTWIDSGAMTASFHLALTAKIRSILSSDSRIEKRNRGMQAMNCGTPVGNGVQPVRRGGANNSLFNRIGGRTINNAVLITDIDRISIKSSSTCNPAPRLSSMRTTTAMCTGHSFPASTIIQVYRAPSSQRCSGGLAASGYVSALIDRRLPSHFTSGAYFRPPLSPMWVFLGYSRTANARASWLRRCRLLRFLPQAAFHSACSPSHSPSSCTSRARPVPCGPLALVVLRVLCLRCRPEALKRRDRSAERERSTTTNGASSSPLQRSCPTTATATNGGGPNWTTSPRFAATHATGHGIVELMSQSEYGDLIPMFGIVNEATPTPRYSLPRRHPKRRAQLLHWHNDATTSKHATRFAASQARGPSSASTTASRAPHGGRASTPGSDRIIFDTHPWFAFDGAPNDSPIATDFAVSSWVCRSDRLSHQMGHI